MLAAHLRGSHSSSHLRAIFEPLPGRMLAEMGRRLEKKEDAVGTQHWGCGGGLFGRGVVRKVRSR